MRMKWKLSMGWLVLAILPALQAAEGMPAAQQNALVQKYCAVCHTDAQPSGGLTLEHFDATHADRALVAMMVSKLKYGALGASGTPLPDVATRDAFLEALTGKSVGASEWAAVEAQGPVLIASRVQASPSMKRREPDLYRLTLTCNSETHRAEMQLSWSPDDVSTAGGEMSAVVDDGAPLTIQVNNGDGASVLWSSEATPKVAWPKRSLAIRDLFPGSKVVFAFDGLAQPVARCFSDAAR